MSTEEKMPLLKRYETVAEQIAEEEGQVNKRMTWMLTFQGLLFATIALLGKDDIDAVLRKALVVWVPWLGIAVALLALIGIGAAYCQIRRIRRNWYDAADESVQKNWPPIFGSPTIHFFGMAPSIGTPLILIAIWIILMCQLQ